MVFFRLFNNVLRKNLYNSQRNMSKDRYVWIDLEMTGLDPEQHKILEIACIITTPDLNILHEGIDLVIHQENEVLDNMNNWCKKHHAETGLAQASRDSNISVMEADAQVALYIKKHSEEHGVKYLAGNTVYMDRYFLNKYMPTVDSLLHYRLIDVSSIKILCSHWCPDVLKSGPQKKRLHRSLEDIKESIDELKYYQSAVFK